MTSIWTRVSNVPCRVFHDTLQHTVGVPASNCASASSPIHQPQVEPDLRPLFDRRATVITADRSKAPTLQRHLGPAIRAEAELCICRRR